MNLSSLRIALIRIAIAALSHVMIMADDSWLMRQVLEWNRQQEALRMARILKAERALARKLLGRMTWADMAAVRAESDDVVGRHEIQNMFGSAGPSFRVATMIHDHIHARILLAD